MITRTISILDNRLTLTEDRISSLLAHSRGLTVANPQNIHASDSNMNEFENGDKAFEVEDVIANSEVDEDDVIDSEN